MKEKTSQEIIKNIRYAVQKRNRTPEENKEYCKKYPFLLWRGDPLYAGYDDENIDYTFTWEDDLEPGWIKAFCPQMWDELKEILEKYNCLDDFRFTQIKEKWGQLDIDFYGLSDPAWTEVFNWTQKYHDLAETVCINCGKSSSHMTLGYITFICNHCYNKLSEDKSFIAIPKEDLNEYYRDRKSYLEKKRKQKND